jgi:hypothetical protein
MDATGHQIGGGPNAHGEAAIRVLVVVLLRMLLVDVLPGTAASVCSDWSSSAI